MYVLRRDWASTCGNGSQKGYVSKPILIQPYTPHDINKPHLTTKLANTLKLTLHKTYANNKYIKQHH